VTVADMKGLALDLLGVGFSLIWGSGLHEFIPQQKEVTGFGRVYLFLFPPVFVWILIILVLWKFAA
jgi:hypothetical protein